MFMSKDITLFDGGSLPTYLKTREIDDITKSLMGNGGGGVKRISIKGGVWRMMAGGKEVAKNEERSMNVVIVNAAPHNSRTYYAGTYSEGSEPARPECWSANGTTPDPKASNPQASRCVDCPQNVKGSGQGDSRACRFNRRLAIVLAHDLEGDVYQLTLPAKSIFGEGEHGKWPLESYGKFIGSKGIPITAVVTEARFDTSQATPTLTFKPVRFLEANEHEVVIRQGASDAAKRAITMTVAEADSVKKPSITDQTKAAAVNAAIEAAAEVSEPVKRTSKKTEAPTEKADLSKILETWDD
jgi:hypothetical protein